MGNVEDRDAKILFELAQTRENRGPQRGIDHRDRLVSHDHLGATQERTRHHQALFLPTTQLMGKAPQGLRRAQAHFLHRLRNQVAAFLFTLRQAKALDRHLQDMIDPIEGIIGGVRILVDRLHFPGQRALLFARHAR